MIYLKTTENYLFFNSQEDYQNWLICQENEPTIIEEGDAKEWFNERFIKTEKINLMIEKKTLLERKEEILRKLTEINQKLEKFNSNNSTTEHESLFKL